LGLGNLSTQPVPKRININSKIKQVSSSKDFDGHSLALSDKGEVYSWGNGKFDTFIVTYFYLFILNCYLSKYLM